MALEKIWQAIPASPILEIGPAASVRVASAGFYRAEMRVILRAVGEDNLTLKVKRVEKGFVYLSFLDGGVPDILPFASGTIEANEQEKKQLTLDDQDGDRYERSPTNADRNVLVSKEGEYLNTQNFDDVEGSVLGNIKLNTLVKVPYDDIEVTQFNNDGDPTEIFFRRNGNDVAIITITYNNDGDFQRAQVTHV